MADSDFGSQLHNALPVASTPTPPTLRPPNSNTLSPPYPHFRAFSGVDLPGYNHLANSQRPHLPEPNNNYHHSYLHNRFTQLPPNPGPRGTAYYPPTMPMFQQAPHTGSNFASPAATAHYHGLHTSGEPFTQCPEPRALPAIGHSIHGGAPDFAPPSFSPWSSSPASDFNRFYSSYAPSTPSTAGRNSGERRGDGRFPPRRPDSDAPDLPRHMTSPSRRISHDQQLYHNTQTPGGSERRPLSAVIAPTTPRSDQSTSPRTSNRRSYDRYSTDLSQPEDTDTNDTAQAPMHRVRRPRTLGFSSSYRARMTAHQDPNIPTPSQVQALRDKLRHYLPSELPKDTSTMCDICQKDYSTEHVDPSEETEVAIMLPCKHVFGEHCINTWFETCKTHKNKVTCPMCRKLLIEPVPARSALRPGHHEVLQALGVTDRSSLERYLQLQDRELFGMAARQLEGDFSHP